MPPQIPCPGPGKGQGENLILGDPQLPDHIPQPTDDDRGLSTPRNRQEQGRPRIRSMASSCWAFKVMVHTALNIV